MFVWFCVFSPSFKMFFAALMSLWWCVPQMGHFHVRILSVRLFFLVSADVASFAWWIKSVYLYECFSIPFWFVFYHVLVVCIIQFFVVFVTIWCFGTFLWCLNLPLLWYHIFFTRYLLNWWYAFCVLLFFLFSHLWYFFLVFFDSFCSCIFCLDSFFWYFFYHLIFMF